MITANTILTNTCEPRKHIFNARVPGLKEPVLDPNKETSGTEGEGVDDGVESDNVDEDNNDHNEVEDGEDVNGEERSDDQNGDYD